MQNTFVKILVLCLFLGNGLFAQKNKSLILHEKKYSIKKYTTENGLTHNEIRSLVQDSFGFLWIAGLDRITRFDGDDFKAYYHEPKVKNSLPNYEIQSLMLDERNQLWVLTPNNLCRFDRSSERFIEYSSRKQTQLKSDIIYSCTNSPNNSLWIYGNKGISNLDAKSNTFSHYNIHCFSDNELREGKMWIDNAMQFWIYSNGFVYKGMIKTVSGDEQIVYFYTKIAINLPPLPSSKFAIQAKFIEATDGSVFMAGNRGLYFIDLKKGNSKEASWQDLKAREFRDIGTILWSADGKGIFEYTPATKKIINIGFDEAQYPECFILDRNKCLWFGGLDKSKDASGLNMVNEFIKGSGNKGKDDEFNSGGLGGIVGNFPDSMEILNKKYYQTLLITSILSSGNEFLCESAIYEVNQIRFPRSTNNFKINFSCVDFLHNDKISYRYRLKGYEKDWVLTDSKHRVAYYSSMHPGSYLFEVESTDYMGQWANHTELSIIIPAWFYETFTFKLAMIFVLAFFISWFVNFRFRQMQHYERRKQEQLKLESLRGQMNPHFTFNSLNAVNYFISINDKKRANEYISDLSRLMRSILTNAQNEFIPLELEINNINDYLKLEHLRFSDKFDFEVVIDEEMFSEGIKVAPFLVQPFAENAILHGLCTLSERKGKLKLRFQKGVKNFILCFVEDDGIGRKKSQDMKSELEKNHQSRGIDLTIERLNIMNSLYKTNHKIQINDLYSYREDTGTKVIIEIPFIY